MRHVSEDPGSRPARRRWHRVYYFLALFDVLVVAFGLGLNHLLIDIHTDSIRENEIWESRLDRYLDLSELAAAVNAPGNDVFDSQDAAAESTRMDEALVGFQRHMTVLRNDLRELAPRQATKLGADLDRTDQAMLAMTAQAGEIFGLFAQGRAARAATRMAAMDRSYHTLNTTLTTLRKDVSAIQVGMLEQQATRARSLQRFEYVIAGFVLAMITAALFYGRRIRREMESRADAEARYVGELETAQAELKAAHDELESRVAGRTHELADANAALHGEIEERTRAQRQLEAANATLEAQARRLRESNRDLQDFAYVASHDLQEPLRKILAFSDRLESRCAAELDETGRDYLARMRNASTRMQTLIDDLLTFSRIQTRANVNQTTDLATVAGGVVADLEIAIEQAGARVEIGELPTLEADPSQMRQLFQNLLGNALKFRRDGVAPEMSVAASVTSDDRVVALPGTDPRVCTITFTDNGIGFEPEYAEKIFTVFQRLHARGEYEGSGVGLAVCRRIAERHSGTITATSVPGVGSRFTVTLPMAQPVQQEDPDVPEQRSHALAG